MPEPRGGLDDRLVHLGDLAACRILGGIRHHEFGAILHDHAVDHVGRGGDEIKIKFALEALTHDLHMQQPEEADPEAKAQRARGFRLEAERCIVELQLVQGLAQLGIIGPVNRVEAGEHHRLRRPIATEIVRGRPVQRRNRVADTRLPDVLYAGDQVADLANSERGSLGRLGEITPTSNVSCAALVDIIKTRSRCDSVPSTTRT